MRILLCVFALVFVGNSRGAPPPPNPLKVTVLAEPAGSLTFRQSTSTHGGVTTHEITLVNSSSSEAALESVVVEIPWQHTVAGDTAMLVGGWDMGRTEARVYDASYTKAESGTYIIAHTGEKQYALAGFTSWRTFTSKLAFVQGKLTARTVGEGRLVRPGETVVLEKIVLTSNADWQDLLYHYADLIAAENKIHLNPPRDYIGWATWDYYGRDWTAQNVHDNVDAVLQAVPQTNFAQVDGGWWPQRGDYQLVRESLQPNGMKDLADYFHAHKLQAGIHLDGMRGDSKAKVALEHPDYFLHDSRKKMLTQKAARGNEGLDYTFFDFSNPAACDYMEASLHKIRQEWGYEYFKIDFLRFGINEFVAPIFQSDDAGIVASDRHLTSVERFHRGMAAFRKGMGPDAYFLACSAVFGPTFGHVDALRSGADINPQFDQYRNCAVDNSGNFYLHGKVVYTDADYHVVRGPEDQDQTRVKAKNKNGNTTQNEAEMWTHYVALFGGTKLNSDDFAILRPERRELFKTAAAIPSSSRYVPLDLWQHARTESDPAAVILGARDKNVYLGIFNWTDHPRSWRIYGFASSDERKVKVLGGVGDPRFASDSMTMELPARHSTILEIPGGDFDKLRHALEVR